MTKVFTFDEAGMKKIAEAVTRLHAQTEHVRGELARVQSSAAGVPQQSMKPQIRTGITATTPDIVTYPTNEESCLFPFHVFDLGFDVADIDSDCVSTQDREWSGVYHIGRTIDGSYIPAGTPIVFAEIPHSDGKQFWIMQVGSPESHAGPRWMVMRDDLLPYQKNKKAAFANYNPATDTWEDDGSDLTGTQELHDDGGQACALRDELIFAFPRPFDATNNPTLNQWDIVYNHGLQRKGKVNGGDVLCGEVGNLEIWRNETLVDCDGIKLESPDVLIPFCNDGLGYHRKLYGPQIAASNAVQDELWIGFDGYSWHAVRDTIARVAFAEATTSFCQSSVVGVAEIRYRDWQPQCKSVDQNIDNVDNDPHRLSGSAGDGLVLLWNEEAIADKDRVWTVAQVEHKPLDTLTEITNTSQDDCPELVYKRERITTMQSDACPVPSPSPFLVFEQTQVVFAARYNAQNCSFYQTLALICVPAGTIQLASEVQLNLGEAVTVATALTPIDVGGPDNTTDCGLQLSTAIICSLNPVTPGPQPDSIDFTPEDVIENVHDESDGLHQDKAQHWVLCSNPPVDELVVEYTECDDEGGTEDIT